MYGTMQKPRVEHYHLNVTDYTVDDNVVIFPFVVPNNSIIKEMVMYNHSNTEEEVRLVRLEVEERSFKYKRLETGNSYEINIHVWKGGVVECKIYDSVVTKLDIFYTINV